jgi:hypothetical protein
LANTPSTVTKGGPKKEVAFIIAAVLLCAFGLNALVGGAYVLYLNSGTDSEGYALSQTYPITTASNAFTLWVAPMHGTGSFSWLGNTNIAATKWVVSTSNQEQLIFAGWGKASNVEPYLNAFSFETPQNWNWHTEPYKPQIDIPSTTAYNQGINPTRPPTQENFWTKTATTTNTTAIYWDPNWDAKEGMNSIVIMNADGSSGIHANIQLGFKVPILGWLPYLLIPAGILLLTPGLLLFKRRKKP